MFESQALARLEQKVDMFRDEFREYFKLLNMRLDSIEDLVANKGVKRDNADAGDRHLRSRKDDTDIDARVQQRYEHRDNREPDVQPRDRNNRENNLRDTLTRDLTPPRDAGSSFTRPEQARDRRGGDVEHTVNTDKLHNVADGSLDTNARTCRSISYRL